MSILLIGVYVQFSEKFMPNFLRGFCTTWGVMHQSTLHVHVRHSSLTSWVAQTGLKRKDRKTSFKGPGGHEEASWRERTGAAVGGGEGGGRAAPCRGRAAPCGGRAAPRSRTSATVRNLVRTLCEQLTENTSNWQGFKFGARPLERSVFLKWKIDFGEARNFEFRMLCCCYSSIRLRKKKETATARKMYQYTSPSDSRLSIPSRPFELGYL